MFVYPNPTQGTTNIVVHNMKDKKINIKLFNILGKEVKDLFNGQVSENYHQIDTDLSSLDKGIYFVSIYQGSNLIASDKILLSK